ncbi:YetF domain-containing protein [Flavobacterium selenitireducens]|uniref:YetF domain-containing protein n=1 Tax=Flavobacterium selenitireducens TaxID=2722704 RepID=UPI00168B1EB9|nr:YetF domain-containing protein [Flavobacterium selenitireducens]MBD3581407.1 DUF421 domain-containing protein [Flavobacterium selenitireducens]
MQENATPSEGFDWETFLRGSEDWSFHWEIVLRTAIMYVVILCALSVLGKRGVKQLSVFELVIIIGFGSAAGDPMFYKDVGLVNAVVVLSSIIILYKITTHLVFKSEKFEQLIEGKPICLVNDGKFSISNFNKENLGYDEFFAEMRVKSVSHLGQIEKAIIEVSGEVSLYFYADADVRFGLPILPELYAEKHRSILSDGIYSCSFCGHTEQIAPTDTHICPECKRQEWVTSIDKKRIS